MNILFISPEFPPTLSGMGDYTFHLSNQISMQGHVVTVLANKCTSPEIEPTQGPQIQRTVVNWDRNAWLVIKDLLSPGAFHVVHIQYLNLTFNNKLFIHFLPLLIRVYFPRIKTVVTFHEFAAPWKRLMLLPLILFSDAHIVTNEHHFKKLKKLCGRLLSKNKAHRIPLAANITPQPEALKKRSDIREQLGILPDETLLVRFGIIHDIAAPQIQTVLESLAHLRNKGSKIKLLLIGKEESAAKQRVLEKIVNLKIKDSVMIKTDLSPEIVSAYLYASDIGLGLYPDGVSEKRTAFLSLLAHKLPVIATQRGELPSELIPEESILTVSHNASSTEWSNAIEMLINSVAMREALQKGSEKVTLNHQWKKIAENTLVLYLQILKSP